MQPIIPERKQIMIPITEIHPMLVHFPIVLWISSEFIAVCVLLTGGDLSSGRQHWSLTAPVEIQPPGGGAECAIRVDTV